MLFEQLTFGHDIANCHADTFCQQLTSAPRAMVSTQAPASKRTSGWTLAANARVCSSVLRMTEKSRMNSVASQTYIDVEFGGLQLRARLLDDCAPSMVAAFRAALPLDGRAFQDQYSAQLMRITSQVHVDQPDNDRRYGYQQAGLLMPLAICSVARGR